MPSAAPTASLIATKEVTMTDFDVNNPDEVASAQVLEADLGIGGRRLIVASGIVRPEWTIDTDEVTRGGDVVHLRIPADRVEGVTVHIGLASIGNDDSEYAFAVDEAVVVVNGATGQLDLGVKTAIMGETSSLNRYSYQVVASIVRDVAEISGVISWPRSLLTPQTRQPSELAGHLTVQLNERSARPAGGPFGGEVETLVPILAGEITVVTIDETTVAARYRILNPPKAKQLRVTVVGSGFAIAPPTQLTVGPVTPGSDIFTLGLADPSRSGVDFRIGAVTIR